jgi:hypothetical protein
LIVSEDLMADKASGPFDEVVAEAVKRFQVRHGPFMRSARLVNRSTISA